MGRAPSEPFREEGSNHDVWRRERRGTRSPERRGVGPSNPDPRPLIGRLAEDLAVATLASHGVEITHRNLVVAGGELDIVGYTDGKRVAFEVRSVTGRGDPVYAYDDAKSTQVRRLAQLVRPRCARVDLVAVAFRAGAVEVTWLRGVD